MPVKKKIPIEGLLEGYEAALAQTGYSITTKLLLVKRAELMIRRHLNTGLEYFDQAVINRYVSEIDDKYFKGKMQNKHYERTKREIDRFVSYVCTGRIDALPKSVWLLCRMICSPLPANMSSGGEFLAVGILIFFHPQTVEH